MLIHDDLNRELSLSDYDRVREQFVELCVAGGIKSDKVGFFGEIGCPGISDVDAIAVGSPAQLHYLSQAVESLREADSKFRYCFWHPPVYVLDEICASLRSFHTLRGLRPLAPGLLSSLTSGGDEEWVLSRVWFTFLLRCLVDMQPVTSLRWLLLMHRSLEHSLLSFSNVSPLMGHLPSTELRKHVMAFSTEGSNWALKFSEMVDSAAKSFDQACDQDRGAHPAIASIALGFRHSLRFSDTTRVEGGRNRIIRTNGLALKIALAHIAPGGANGAFNDFSRSSRRVADLYHKVALPYPFVTPFGMPVSGWRRHLTVLSARILSSYLPHGQN